jgi:hypothetical protein
MPFALVSLVLKITKDVLRQNETLGIAFDRDDWIASLKDPGIHQGADRLT